MPPFVPPDSVVRRVWARSDAVLLVFGGAAAEFALNRAVDWLFVTGAIPRDPMGRLFSTMRHAREILFGSEADAARVFGRIRAAHAAVERARGDRIPDWAHRDVLYLLIHYTERAGELLRGPFSAAEREDLYGHFRRVGDGLGIPALPSDYAEWREDRARHLARDLAHSPGTDALYAAYRRQLGPLRYALLLRAQALLAPAPVRALLGLPADPAPWPARAYRALDRAGLRPLLLRLLVPAPYLPQVRALDEEPDYDTGSAGRGGGPTAGRSRFDSSVTPVAWGQVASSGTGRSPGTSRT